MPYVFRGKKAGRKPLDPIKRFWERCDKSGGSDACWNWTAGCFVDGYGQIKVKGKPTKAHRLSWEIHNGPIPAGKLICHSCDNNRCVNPKHLFLGTHKDNMDDMRNKGRDNYVRSQWGENHADAKLTEKDVLEIRRLKEEGVSANHLSERFGVCAVQIRAIIRRQYWKHI